MSLAGYTFWTVRCRWMYHSPLQCCPLPNRMQLTCTGWVESLHSRDKVRVKHMCPVQNTSLEQCMTFKLVTVREVLYS